METLRKPATIIWAALMLATCASTWWLGKDLVLPTAATVAIVIIAAVKIRLVLMHFMELRTAPWAWRLVFEIWLVAITGLIVGFYLL
jgi:heme/copper-type cytochrome/quinol oxidase subunit 4